jgi:hypothetical protein
MRHNLYFFLWKFNYDKRRSIRSKGNKDLICGDRIFSIRYIIVFVAGIIIKKISVCFGDFRPSTKLIKKLKILKIALGSF